MKKRYLYKFIVRDLKSKMVFIGGPRQVGKTTLSKQIGDGDYKKFTYLNWDNFEDKKIILRAQLDPKSKLYIFDEIHKYKSWKNFVKGIYDKFHSLYNIIVTGSARLDVYRRGGDSMMGRYYYYRLHPFSVAEILEKENKISVDKPLEFIEDKNSKKVFEKLFKIGGFPEPFIDNKPDTLRRWQNNRLDRLVKEDIRDIENLRDLSSLQLLLHLLPAKVGSLFSLNSLREDLNVTHKTLSLWMDILERFYYHFRIYPFNVSTIKSLRNTPKIYLWDWSEVENDGARLENILASHLLKLCHFLYDVHGYKAELNFLRDADGREVDFLITVNKKLWFAVEVKNTDQKISDHLKYFKKKLNLSYCYQIVKTPNVDFIQNDIRVMSADLFLSGLI